jgi:hypothetical protein
MEREKIKHTTNIHSPKSTIVTVFAVESERTFETDQAIDLRFLFVFDELQAKTGM